MLGLSGRAPQTRAIRVRPFDVGILGEPAIYHVVGRVDAIRPQALDGWPRQTAIGAAGLHVHRDDHLARWLRYDLHVVGGAKATVGPSS
jgi:hypothetical protein